MILYEGYKIRLSKKLDETYIPYRLTLSCKEHLKATEKASVRVMIIEDEFSQLGK